MVAVHPTPALDALVQAEPDLVDRIFDYILTEHPELAARMKPLKSAVRAEFRGEECYIAGRPASDRQETVSQVLALIANGKNKTTIARQLKISRTTVHRILVQAGK